LTVTCASPNPSAYVDLPTASSIGCLLEINHYFKTGGLHPGIPGLQSSGSHRPPFDHVRIVYGGQASSQEDHQRAVKEVALTLLYGVVPDSITTASHEGNAHSPSWLTTISVDEFELDHTLNPRRANASLLLEILVGWLRCLDEGASRANIAAPVKVAEKTLERMEFLVNDLFRACGWNAQTWVRSCMSTTSENQADEPLDAEVSQDPAPARPLTMMEEKDVQELESICDALGIDLQKTAIAFDQLLQGSVQQLQACICGKWLTHSQYWSLLPAFASLITKKFKTQTNSLFVVAQRLGQQHDEMLERMERGVAGADDNDQQLTRLFIESRFHALSGRLLGKFVFFLQQYLSRWREFSNGFAVELLSYANRLCQQELGGDVDVYLSEKSNFRSDQFARKAYSWVNSLLVRFWDQSIGLETRWTPADEDWPKALEWKPQTGAQSCLSDLFDLLNRCSTVKGRNGMESDEEGTDGGSTGLLENATMECQTKAVTQIVVEENSTKMKLPHGLDPIAELEKDLREHAPPLCEFGGDLKQILLIPDMLWYQVPESMRDALTQRCDIQVKEKIDSPLLVSVGSNLDLENMIDRLLMPTSETWQLVPRILSRVDVDWVPFTTTS
jgi:hypothetical protein